MTPREAITSGPRRIACLLPLLLVSCFSYDEELWIERDGSGRARLDVFVAKPIEEMPDIPPWATEEELRESLGDRLISYEVSQRRGTRVFLEYRFSADDRALLRLPGGPKAHELQWRRERGRYHFEKTVRPLSGTPMGPIAGGLALDTLMGPDVPGFRYRVTAHFPGGVLESNARMSEGTTAVWELSLPEAMSGRTLTAEARAGIDPFMVGLVFGGGLCVLALAALVIAAVVLLVRSRRQYPGEETAVESAPPIRET